MICSAHPLKPGKGSSVLPEGGFLETQQILFLVIMVTSVFLFMTSYLQVDVVGVLTILALAITGVLDVKSAFSGFSSEPAIIVCAVFVLSAGLTATGLTDQLGEWIGRVAGSSEIRANLVIMVSVALLSAFTHHLMITAMMLPIVMKICKDKGLAPSRLLIPMATSASLGTTLTLIGAPAFLLANSILVRSGEPALSLFSPSLIGGPLLASGLLLIILLLWILPKTSGRNDFEDRFKLSEISTDLVVPPESRWIGKTMRELQSETEKRFTVLSWFRKRRQVLSVWQGDQTIQEGDVLLVKTGSDELVSIEEKLGLALRGLQKYGEDEPKSSLAGEEHRLFQAVIAPKSPFIGRSISEIHFYHRYGVVAVGLWRKTGWIKEEISNTPLKEGDLIVLWGPEEELERLTNHRGFLMFLPFSGKSKLRMKMKLAAFIMIASILTAALGWLPAYVAFVAGAIAMVLTKCVDIEDAYQSIETKIFVLIAGVIPLGIAMEKTGVDRLLAEHIVQWTSGWSPFSMLLVFFWFAALLTQILSDAATTVLIAPIAIAFAKAAGLSPTAAVVTVTIGAIASFLSPIGHHGNLLILSPGGYRFVDFLKIGLPLTLMISVMTCWLALQVWNS